MGTTHIPVAEAARDLPGLLARVRAGEDIVIDDGSSAPVHLAPAPASTGPRTIEDIVAARKLFHGTPLSEAIARLDVLERERGHPMEMTEDYSADMREILRDRKPRDTSAWD